MQIFHMRKSVAELLDPHHEVVDFVGRSAELGELLAWCADGADTPVRIVIGSAGTGKTRLGVELARQLRARGWRIEWPGTDQNWSNRVRPGAIAFPRKLLLIVDQADERADLAELITAVTQDRPQARLLLLAAGAGSWCDQLELFDLSDYRLISAARSTLIELPFELAPGLAQADVTARAAACYATELGRTAKPQKAAAGPDQLRVLDLHRAALASVVGKDAEPTWPQSSVREYLLGSHFATESTRLPERVADALVLAALSTSAEFARDCLGGIKLDQALPAVRLLGRASIDRLPSAPLPESAITLLASEITGLDGPVPALSQLFNALPYPAATWDSASVATCQRITDQLGQDANPAVRAYWLNNLGTRCWHTGRPDAAVRATGQAVALRRELVAEDPDRHLASLAFSLSSLGIQRIGLGETAQAIAATQEATTIFRAAAVASPGRYLPALAASLDRLGASQARDAAAAAAGSESYAEAISIWRELAKAAPAQYESRLARSLKHQANPLVT
jgi:hypothetical protein